MELSKRVKGKKNDRASVILHTLRYKGRKYKDVYWKLLKNMGWEVWSKAEYSKGLNRPKQSYLTINLSINSNTQDWKIGTVFVGGSVLVWGEGWMKEIKVTVYVDRLHIPIWNRTKKPLAIAFSGVGRLRRRDNGQCN
jgi:hypothetical protein